MIIQQVVDGKRQGQQIFVPKTVRKGQKLPICLNVDERPTNDSPTFAANKLGQFLNWIVLEE